MKPWHCYNSRSVRVLWVLEEMGPGLDWVRGIFFGDSVPSHFEPLLRKLIHKAHLKLERKYPIMIPWVADKVWLQQEKVCYVPRIQSQLYSRLP